MTDFFREVDEDIRRDKAAAILGKYQYWFVALAIVIVAATISWRVYESRRLSSAESASAQYESALQLLREDKGQEAETSFTDLGKDGPSGYRALASLSAADILAGSDRPAALQAYRNIEDDTRLDPSLRDTARLRALLLQIDQLDPQQIASEVEPLGREDSAFTYRNSVRELLGLSALKRNEYEAAGRWFDEIVADPAAPSSLRRRAEAFLGLVAAGKRTAKPAAAETK